MRQTRSANTAKAPLRQMTFERYSDTIGNRRWTRRSKPQNMLQETITAKPGPFRHTDRVRSFTASNVNVCVIEDEGDAFGDEAGSNRPGRSPRGRGGRPSTTPLRSSRVTGSMRVRPTPLHETLVPTQKQSRHLLTRIFGDETSRKGVKTERVFGGRYEDSPSPRFHRRASSRKSRRGDDDFGLTRKAYFGAYGGVQSKKSKKQGRTAGGGFEYSKGESTTRTRRHRPRTSGGIRNSIPMAVHPTRTYNAEADYTGRRNHPTLINRVVN